MEETTTKSKVEKIRDWAQFLILIFSAMGAAFTFYYKEMYVPEHRPASLVVTGTLEEIGRKDEFALVRARVHVVNKEEVKIFAPALWFTVSGLQFQVRKTPYKPDDPKLKEGESYINTFSNYSDVQKEVVSNWKLGYSENWYEKDGEETYEELFYVPHEKYQVLELRVKHWLVKQEIKDVALVKWEIFEDGSLWSTIMMKMPGFDKDKQHIEAYDPKNLQHKKMLGELGEGEYVSTLSFLPVKAAVGRVGR